MKGVIFNLLEEFSDENLGEDTWEQALEQSGNQDKFFVGTNTYSDSILLDIFGKLISLKSIGANKALNLFGEFTFNALAKKYSDILKPFNNSKEVLMGLDSIIHVEVRKLIAESDPPGFIILREEKDELDLEYRSKRELCALATGLLNGLQKLNNNDFEFTHSECKHENGEKCVFSFKFKE